jgi:RNA polymerase sigma-70 factor (sigma-E family)
VAWCRINGDPEPYVRKIIANTYASWWRRRWTSEQPTDRLPEPRAGDPDPHARVDDRDEVWQALGQLPKRQRAVLVLRYFEDLSEAEIANALDCSVGTVKSQASRALAKLRLERRREHVGEPD